MSNRAPAGDLLARKLAVLYTARDAIELLAVEYHSAIRPVRDALQAVADAPLEDRKRWAEAFSVLACRLKDNGLADVSAHLVTLNRWDSLFEGGQPGQAVAGLAFCTALADAVAKGTPPDGFFATLDHRSFVTTPEATMEVCAALAHLLYVHTQRATPDFAARFGVILADAGTSDGYVLRGRLELCHMPLTLAAAAALANWDHCRSGSGFYAVDIRPCADRAAMNDEAESSEGESPPPTGTPPGDGKMPPLDARTPPPTDATAGKKAEEEKPPAAANDAPVRPAKRRIPRTEAERLVADAIANTPLDRRDNLTVRYLNQATGVSIGMIWGLDSWRKLQHENKRSVRLVPLTDAIHAVLADPSADAADPAEAAADAELLAQLLAFAATPSERMRYETMSPGDRCQMLELLREQTADARRDRRRPRRERPDCS